MSGSRRAATWLAFLFLASWVAPAALGRGVLEKRTYRFAEAGKDMEYRVFVPSSYDKRKPTPLMLVLHGFGSNPKQILGYRGMTKLAEEHGVILGAPMGYNERGWYGNAPPMRNVPRPANLYELSEKDVMNVLDRLLEEFNVDRDRVYLMGHSMGGGGTWHLGIKYPELWAGLAPVAPAIFASPNELEKIRDLPVILVQGDADPLVPVAGARRWAAKMKELGMDYSYLEVPGGNHIQPAIDKLPDIFEFLLKHTRPKPPPGADAKSGDDGR